MSNNNTIPTCDDDFFAYLHTGTVCHIAQLRITTMCNVHM